MIHPNIWLLLNSTKIDKVDINIEYSNMIFLAEIYIIQVIRPKNYKN
jgi:hypothetical protein